MDATVLASIFFKEFTKKSAAKILDYFTEKFKKEGDSNYSNCKKALESHLSEVIKWCSRIDFIGLEKPKSIENDTIPLIISSSIRTYGNIQGKDISELELLNSNENYVVLGDPGSGKSTTLKRIARDFFWGKIEYSFEYIILVRLKDIEQGGLLTFIANTLGIVWHNVKKEVGPEKFVYEQYVGTEILENAIPQFLKKINALLILDGFDELNSDVSSVIKSDIKILSRKSIGYKILLTSRYGEILMDLRTFHFVNLKS